MSWPALTIVLSVLAAYATATLAARWVGTAGFPLPASGGRMGCIDGLRGYLALSVLAHHFVLWMQVTRGDGRWREPDQALVNQLGAGAVGLFFMITGFVFYRRVLTGFRGTSWVAVYVTRIFRILPLVIASTAAIVMLACLRSGHALGLHDLPALARWITGWGEPDLAGGADTGRINAYVLWSLHYEWLFYVLVLPAAALASDLLRGHLASVAIPLGLVAIAATSVLLPQFPLLHWLPLFAAGMLGFEARDRPWLAASLRHPAASLIAGAALIVAAALVPVPISWALPAFVLFFACVACGNSFFGLLATRGAVVLGEVSFSIYLLHGLVLSLLFTEGHALLAAVPTGSLPLLLPIVSVIVTMLACATYLGIERPAMRLGSQLARRWTDIRVRSRSPEVEVAP